MYQDLYEEYIQAATDLSDWMPEPHIVFPRNTVIGIIKQATDRLIAELIEDTRYLEAHERTDGIPIATASRTKKINRLLEQLADEESAIFNAVTTAALDHVLRYKRLSLKLSEATMPAYRANRRRLLPAKERFDKAQAALDDFYISLCTGTSVTRDMKAAVYYELSEIPRRSGLYFIIFDGEVVYIGRSENIYNRLNNHDIVRKYRGQGDLVYGIIELSAGKAKSIELDVIEILRPAENINGKKY